jgi:hypothetical protein
MAIFKNLNITREFLDRNFSAYFIFGDNITRTGYGGAASLRDHPHSLGFITKKYPDNIDSSFYRPDEYASVFIEELLKLKIIIEKRPEKTFYISQLGAGLANKYNIWEIIIKNKLISTFKDFENVVFCWNE